SLPRRGGRCAGRRPRLLRRPPPLAFGLRFAHQATEAAQRAVRRHAATLTGLRRCHRGWGESRLGGMQELLYEGQLGAGAGGFQAVEDVLVEQLAGAGGVWALVDDVVRAAPVTRA